MATLSTEARNLIADGLGAGVALGTLEVRDATTVLAEVDLPDPAFAGAVDGVVTLTGSWTEASAVASGTADNFILRTAGGDSVCTGSVGVSGSGSDVELNTVSIATGQAVTVTTAVFTAPGGASSVSGTASVTLGAVTATGDGTVAASGVTPYYDFRDVVEGLANTTALLALPNVNVNGDPTQGDGEINLRDISGISGIATAPSGVTKCIERYWPTGNAGAGQVGINIALPNGLVDQPRDLWIELYVNFKDHDQGALTGDKLLFLQDEDDQRWDLMQQSGGSGRVFTLAGLIEENWQAGDGETGGNLDWRSTSSDTPREGLNEWTQLRFRCRMGRPTDPGNGLVRVLVDGELRMEDTGQTNDANDDHFLYLQIGANSAAASQARQYWIAPIFYDSDPGWGI